MPAKIRTLIVDDEALARAKLRQFLSAEPDVEIVGEAGDGASAVDAIITHAPELVFLDVQMPELDGFGVLANVGDRRPRCVIFVTAHDDFALKAFDVHAIDYLLKPYDRDRFVRALSRARELLRATASESSPQTAALSGLLAEVATQRPPAGRIAVKSDGRIVLLKVAEIDWIEAADNYAVLHVGKDSHIVRETMNSLEARLDPEQFLRINRSTIVNIERIRDLEPLFHGEYSVRLHNGTKLTCSRGYKDRLRQFLAGS
jgi:two-component system LytT family response regulator